MLYYTKGGSSQHHLWLGMCKNPIQRIRNVFENNFFFFKLERTTDTCYKNLLLCLLGFYVIVSTRFLVKFLSKDTFRFENMRYEILQIQ